MVIGESKGAPLLRGILDPALMTSENREIDRTKTTTTRIFPRLEITLLNKQLQNC